MEILGDKIDITDRLADYIGSYYSHEWVRRNILGQSEKEMQELDAQIKTEKESGNGEEDPFI